ncbi:MAG TPA: CPBP family intramembrane glutamic endopeptidase [Anaerolineales bacterium]|nr:CPBP family intramembrane glutamic endopeptidase [Anaerolineales bacterium]
MLSSKKRSSYPAWQSVVILVYATVALVLDYYHRFPPAQSGVLYLLVPLLMLIAFKRPLKAYGARAGQWRKGLLLTLGGWMLMAPVLWLTVRGPDFTLYYAYLWENGGFWGTLWWVVSDLISWEFFFRGFLIFSLADIIGPWAILFQAMMFTFGHLSKPELETLSCILGGSAFGWVAWETDSFIYPFLIHVFVSFFTIWLTTL